MPSLRKVFALARLLVVDGLKRNALLGLILFAITGTCGGFLFFDFIPRDIGRASNDFLFSIIWITGLIFLLFHAVQVMAWDTNRGALHTYLARPLSRYEYCLGLFTGLAVLLLLLNTIICGLGWLLLLFVRRSVSEVYFPILSFPFYLLASLGLYWIEITILAVILLFSSSVRGSFPVLLLTLCYYFICSGLPVVRESFRQQLSEGVSSLSMLLKGLSAIFPDFSNLDFKTFAVTTDSIPELAQLFLPFAALASYIVIVLWVACIIYGKRDLH